MRCKWRILREDVVDFAGGKTWYRWVNKVAAQGSGGLLPSIKGSSTADNKLPVLVISGGPGLPVSYLESLELMAGVGRPVIFYDQVGIGNTFLASNSTCPPVDQLTLDLYMQQIDALRSSLKLTKCHLYGQGVGGMLALSYASSQHGKQGGICSVTVTAMPSSYKQLIADRQYFAAAGNLVEWDVSTLKAAETLQDMPVLVSCGDGDEVSHRSAQQLVGKLPKAILAVHAGSGSYVHIDAWEPHLTKVEEHLCLSEGSPLPTAV
eukprot:gene6766-6982_t